jgi:hypothetical protein
MYSRQKMNKNAQPFDVTELFWNGERQSTQPPTSEIETEHAVSRIRLMRGSRPDGRCARADDRSWSAMIDQQPQVVSTTTFCLSGCRSTDYPCQHIPH